MSVIPDRSVLHRNIFNNRWLLAGQGPVDLQADSPVESLARCRRFAVASSRVSRWTATGDPWAQRIMQCLAGRDRDQWVYTGSLGMLHYDFPMYCWLSGGGRAVAVVTDEPFRGAQAGAYRFFHTHPRLTILRLSRDADQRNRSSAMGIRDRLILAAAEVVCPVMIRAGGRMDGLIRNARIAGRPVVVSGYELSPYNPAVRPVRSVPVPESAAPELGEYLWHFTRSRCDPFPGSGWDSYLQGLAGAADPVPYSGADVLKQIVSHRVLRAAGRLIKGGIPVVSLTGRHPQQMPGICQWQPHLHRTRFEPFALGIHRSAAAALGFHPVVYGAADTFENLPAGRKYLFQHAGTGKNDWTAEDEWRCAGDADFKNIPDLLLRIIVPDPLDADALRPYTSIQMVCWNDRRVL